MPIVLDRKALVSPTIEMPDSDCPVRNMIPLRVPQSNPPHKVRQVAVLTRPQKQMPVIARNAVTANPHGEPLGALCQYLLKSDKVAVLAENTQTPVRSIERVINIST